MPTTLKRDALLVLGLAGLFDWAFMFAKHNPALRGIIPFGEDPYDAVGSFGVLIGTLIALVSLVRAFRPYRKRPTSTAQRVYLVRTQLAVPLIVLIALAADMVAMARHPSTWIRAASRNELIALLAGLALAAVAVQSIVRAPRGKLPESVPSRWPRASIAALLAVFILVLYPERLIDGTATHLLTVVIGAVVLFAPMRPLLAAMAPYDGRQAQTETTPARKELLTAKRRWGVVFLAGALIGGCLFVAEMSEGGGTPPPARLLFIASVYIGLSITGLLLAYAFLGAPLGFVNKPKNGSRPKPSATIRG
jgi:hypothetical protein